MAKQLADSQAKLETEQATLGNEQAQLNDLAVAADRAASRARPQGRRGQRRAGAGAQLIGALRARGEPIQGPTVLSGEQMAGWIRAKGYNPRIQTSIDDLAQIYVDEGNAEGVRGDFAFAQSVVETGGFALVARQQLRRSRVVRQLCPRHRVPVAARRRPRADPAPAELRRLVVAGRKPPQRAVAVLVLERSRPLRHASSTRSSPRAGRRRGTTWVTATGPPTRTTRARC